MLISWCITDYRHSAGNYYLTWEDILPCTQSLLFFQKGESIFDKMVGKDDYIVLIPVAVSGGPRGDCSGDEGY